MHRWIWDLHYTAVPGSTHLVGDEFVVAPRGVTALPGTYTVKLTVGRQSYSQSLTLKMDPRIKTSPAELQKQFDAAMEVSRRQAEISEAQRGVNQLLAQARKVHSQVHGKASLVSALDALIAKAEEIAGAPPAHFGMVPSKPAVERADLESLSRKLAKIFSAINDGDAAPTEDATRAFNTAQMDLGAVMGKWNVLTTEDLPEVNGQLKRAGLPPIVIGAQGPAPVEEAPSDDDDDMN
jgi:hypothetical protein